MSTGNTLAALRPVVSDEDRAGYLASEVKFNAMSNTTCKVAIDGLAGSSGSFVLTWQLEPANATLPVIAQQPVGGAVPAGTNFTF